MKRRASFGHRKRCITGQTRCRLIYSAHEPFMESSG